MRYWKRGRGLVRLVFRAATGAAPLCAKALGDVDERAGNDHLRVYLIVNASAEVVLGEL
jgi:hypothetical protein